MFRTGNLFTKHRNCCALLALCCLGSLAQAQDCALPRKGLWTLDQDHFVQQLSQGNPVVAAKLRSSFSEEDSASTWEFKRGRGVFRSFGTALNVDLQTQGDCRVLMTARDKSVPAPQEIGFRASSKRLCFHYPMRDEGILEECFLRDEGREGLN